MVALADSHKKIAHQLWKWLATRRRNKLTGIKKAYQMISLLFYGVPKGVRTPVTAVKGQCPRPLDDGD